MLLRGLQVQASGHLDEARRHFVAALAAEAAHPAALYSLAALDANQGRWSQALRGFDLVLAARPDFDAALSARAQVQQMLGEHAGVLREDATSGSSGDTQAALPDRPALPAELIAIMGRAQAFQQRGLTGEALAEYASYLHTGNPAYVHVALYNAGVVLSEAGRRLEAEAYFRQCVLLQPDFGLGQVNLGLTIELNGRPQQALLQWRAALELPAFAASVGQGVRLQLLNHIGRLSEQQRDLPAAEAALTESLQLKADQPAVLHHWIHLRQKQCAWPVVMGLPHSVEQIQSSASALAMLGLSDDPADQLASSQRFVAEKVGRFQRWVPKGHRYGHPRLRIGYLSSDLSMHAVSLLTVELFEQHRRDRVEVHAFCWSREDGTAFRQRVRSAFDHFHAIGDMDDESAARLIQAQEIDVLVDLHGLTSNARPNIVARGPAPLQVAFLGFPGPTALPHVDFVVADPFIFPQALEPHFTEAPLRLPTLYQCSDSQRTIGPEPTRSSLGLPDERLVLCAFNNNFKFTPEVFESWMRILRALPDAVLWLLEDNRWAAGNLRHAASAHGVDPQRLIFAPRVQPADYLARFRAADLFLDTYPYNAGTTANDALWAGLPLLTLAGKTYVSRMAGSLLTSAGLSELIANSLPEYEALAIALGTDRARLAELRTRLAQEKSSGRLFSTQRFVQEFEDALLLAIEGSAPTVAADPGATKQAARQHRHTASAVTV